MLTYEGWVVGVRRLLQLVEFDHLVVVIIVVAVVITVASRARKLRLMLRLAFTCFVGALDECRCDSI